MSAGKWTKGPYRTVESMAGVIAEIKAGDVTICDIRAQGVDGKYSNVVTDATATLLAAAPELAEALRNVMSDLRGWAGVVRRSRGHHSQESAAVDARYHAARAALRKAGAGE